MEWIEELAGGIAHEAKSVGAVVVGAAVTFINMAVANVTIAITTDTLTLSPAGTSGSRTLAQYGSATAIKITSTQWLISGSGLT
jgi:thiamine monophosphate kinase